MWDIHEGLISVECMKSLALGGVLPVAPGVAFHHCMQSVDPTRVSHDQSKVYEVMTGLCHLYSLLDKSHKTLRFTVA